MATGKEQPGFRFPKASELLADALRSRILIDGLQPGAALPSEPDLIEQSRLARATVREALRLLEAEGLIEIKRGPRGGIRVREADPGPAVRMLALALARTGAPLRDLFELRTLIEPRAAALAASAATLQQRQALSAAAGAPLQLTGDVEAATDALADFHVLVGEATNNELFRAVLTVVDEIVRLHSRTEALGENDVRQTVALHRRIAAAIAAGDEQGAAEAMARHVRRYERRLAQLGRLAQPVLPSTAWHSPLAVEMGARLSLPDAAKG